MMRTAAGLLLLCVLFPPRASGQSCSAAGTVLQVLGSGGPMVSRDRASASYLVWIGGQARVLVDAGGGAFLRFGQAGAQLGGLSLAAISHLHPDHVSDLPALLWLSDLSRREPLAIAGPSGNDDVPAFPVFLGRLFDRKGGAFQVLSGTLRGPGRGAPLDVAVVDATRPEPTEVFARNGLKVTAIGVPHANIPSLAYRVETPSGVIVFSSDQTGANRRFVGFAKGADLLVMHLAIAVGVDSPLHASPEVVGRIARDAGVKRLVLSHIGGFDPAPAVAAVRTAYTGPLTVGEDLQCTPVR